MAEAKKKASTKKVIKQADEVAETAPIDAVMPEIVETAHDASVEEATETVDDTTEKVTAKAGKRSAKALEAVEAKEAKEERKAAAHDGDETDKPKAPAPKTRSLLERRSKGFRKSAEALETGKVYTIEEAVNLAKQTSHVKFDATVELHVNLNVDPRQADQNIRDNLVLPSGSGKTVVIAVLTDDAAAAKKAGADIAGNDDFLATLEKGATNFDILIATPALMPKLGKYARTLGPRGLMPNPKSGTVTTDVAKAVAEAKAGRVEYRVDSTGIIHLGVGKVSFTAPQLLENVNAVLTSVKGNKPASIKNAYFKTVHLTTSMGPSIAVDLASVNQ